VKNVTRLNKNSSGDEVSNVNFLRRHRTCRGQRLRPLNRLPNLYWYIFDTKAKAHEGHLHCSTQCKFKQQYTVADRSYLLSSNNR